MTTPPSDDFAIVWPEKQFFVSMLTRDIDLGDAILDLIDNCLDGVLRLAKDQNCKPKYSEHFISITFSENEFVIKDNCGGIPRVVAREYAFKMGRGKKDDKHLTHGSIGMYGVGMKRAIFKMGKSASVKTMHGNDCFEVSYTPDWLDKPKWEELAIRSLEENDQRIKTAGTEISVGDLFDGIKALFKNEAFENTLVMDVSKHFNRFLEKGLSIYINGESVEGQKIEFLVDKNRNGPAPYIFRRKIDGVLVTMAVGLNSAKEVEADFADDRSSISSGWTVFCNDRAILFGDKSRLTGWGDGVPRYHDQFSIITGVVQFESDDATKLPTTTTKMSMDLASNIWLETYIEMKKAMRVWTTYTNRWKNYPRESQKHHWKKAEPMSFIQVMDVMLKVRGVKEDGNRVEYNPYTKKHLPIPESEKPSDRRILFSRPQEEISKVSDFLFDTPDKKPSIVGYACFSKVLKDIKKVESQNG